MSDSLQPHELQHARLPCPSLSPGVCSNSCPLCQWCHPTISCSVSPFSSCPQSFPTSGSFPVSQLFSSGCQSIGASASALVLPMNIQGWFPLELTGLITKSLISWKGHWLISPSYNVPDQSPSCLVWMFLLMGSFQYPQAAKFVSIILFLWTCLISRNVWWCGLNAYWIDSCLLKNIRISWSPLFFSRNSQGKFASPKHIWLHPAA